MQAAVSVLLTGLFSVAIATAEDIRSGLPAGARADQFLVKDCTGPAAGKTLCYFCRYAERPVVCVFVRRLDDHVGRLIARIDAAAERHRGRRLAAFTVLIGNDTQAAEDGLKQLARHHRIAHTPLTIFRDQPAKLRETFRIADDDAVTILMWRDGVVQASFGSRGTRLDDRQVEAVLKAMEQMVRE